MKMSSYSPVGAAGAAFSTNSSSAANKPAPRIASAKSTTSAQSTVSAQGRIGIEIEESAVAQRFSKAASKYNKLASIQHTIAQQGLNNLPRELSGDALDIGCGTGMHTQTLSTRGLNAVGVDIADGMLEQARNTFPQLVFKNGSAQALPISDCSIDIAYSSMALQWVNDPEKVGRELYRVLKPGGIAELAIMVSGSFHELKLARKIAQLPQANTPMPSALQWKQAFQLSKLSVKRLITRDYTDSHKDIMSLLRSVKGVGAGETGRQQPPLNRQDIKKLSIAYQNTHGVNEVLPLTYRVCHFRLEKQ